jgi:RNA polymerase sigma-70 factor (ECF subfamily)
MPESFTQSAFFVFFGPPLNSQIADLKSSRGFEPFARSGILLISPAMPSADPRLVAAARRSSPEAWDNLLKQHQLPLFAYAVEFLGDRTAALDVVQETFANAVRHIASLRDAAKFGSWLFGIAHQKCLQHFRRIRRNEEVFSPAVETEEAGAWTAGDEPDPRTMLLQREQADEFFALVERLPAAQRAVLLLHVVEDFSHEEIATITNVPAGTIKSRLFHAKKAMRKLLEEIT